uniref:Cell adhesion molecule 3 n=1 Tax=Sphaeramia orbicularis TaxID=375764 RepID=A0A673AER7_9TELE
PSLYRVICILFFCPCDLLISIMPPRTKDKTASVGGKVTLTCVVAESDNSSLQWSNTAQQTLYFGEKRALRDNRIQLSRSTPTELSITISEVQLSDEGIYTCSIFTMPVRTAQAIVTVLGVPGKPQISGFEDAVPEGSEVTLTCTSTGSKPPIYCMNDYDLKHLKSVPDEPTYNVSSELTLKVSRSDDNALITCAVDHESLAPGDKRSEQVLRVLYSPGVKILPQSDLPKEGEKFYLKCVGSGNPEPTSYRWEKKNGEFPPLAKVEGAYLHFEMLNKSDNGVYLCYAGNGIGTEGLGDSETSPSPSSPSPSLTSTAAPTATPSTSSSLTSSVSVQLNGVYTFTGGDHAVIGGVVAVIVFILLCLLIVLGRYLIRHKGTYLTHEAKGSDDAPDADTAIINAEGGHSGAEDKKEYFI